MPGTFLQLWELVPSGFADRRRTFRLPRRKSTCKVRAEIVLKVVVAVWSTCRGPSRDHCCPHMADEEKVKAPSGRADASDGVLSRLRSAATDGARPVRDTLAPTIHAASTHWREAAGRPDGSEGYQFGDLSRSLFRGARGAAERTRQRWQQERYGIVSEDGEARPPAASSRGSAGASGSACESGASGGGKASVPVVSTVVRGAGQIFGASKGLLASATLGAVKGGVALTDKIYETSSSKVASEDQRHQFHSRLSFAARAAAAEIAPLVGNVVSSFAQGSLEGASAANRSLSTMYERVVPESVQNDLALRLEQRLGAVMEHLVEPAVLTAVQNLYARKIKPELVADRNMPSLFRRVYHDVADQLWSDLMIELPCVPYTSHHATPRHATPRRAAPRHGVYPTSQPSVHAHAYWGARTFVSSSCAVTVSHISSTPVLAACVLNDTRLQRQTLPPRHREHRFQRPHPRHPLLMTPCRRRNHARCSSRRRRHKGCCHRRHCRMGQKRHRQQKAHICRHSHGHRFSHRQRPPASHHLRLTLLAYRRALRRCHPRPRRCHPRLRRCHPRLRRCHPRLRRCHPRPRRCHPRPRRCRHHPCRVRMRVHVPPFARPFSSAPAARAPSSYTTTRRTTSRSSGGCAPLRRSFSSSSPRGHRGPLGLHSTRRCSPSSSSTSTSTKCVWAWRRGVGVWVGVSWCGWVWVWVGGLVGRGTWGFVGRWVCVGVGVGFGYASPLAMCQPHLP